MPTLAAALAELDAAIERAALYRAQTVRLSLDTARALRTGVKEEVAS